MTENEQQNEQRPGKAEPETAAVEKYRAAWAAAKEEAIRVLTAAARVEYPGDGPMDFAGFLAGVLAAVAANLGSSDRLLAGRPGSWEADAIERLLKGTLGWDDEYLLGHRTEQVVIHLNVQRLLEDRTTSPDYLTEYDTAELALQAAENAWHEEHADNDPEEFAAAETAADWEGRHKQLHATWAARNQEFAEAFTAAVLQKAGGIKGFSVPVTVEAITDPDDSYKGPQHPEWGSGIEWTLWVHGISTVPLPPR